MTGHALPSVWLRPGGAAGANAARSRHPSANRWRPDRGRLLERLAERARARGARWPRVAAAVLVLRGIAGDDPFTFAGRLGITVAALRHLEQGSVPPSAIPGHLRAVAELIDWSWVDGEAHRGAEPG
jgi:hypothetical protein